SQALTEPSEASSFRVDIVLLSANFLFFWGRNAVSSKTFLCHPFGAQNYYAPHPGLRFAHPGLLCLSLRAFCRFAAVDLVDGVDGCRFNFVLLAFLPLHSIP
ncbi:MAG TPA: hypothetical protein PKY10_08380, partial [Lentisphaeria bacterium]|nr:hypothetical protein [Lentisphaeria bacterium]